MKNKVSILVGTMIWSCLVAYLSWFGVSDYAHMAHIREVVPIATKNTAFAVSAIGAFLSTIILLLATKGKSWVRPVAIGIVLLLFLPQLWLHVGMSILNAPLTTFEISGHARELGEMAHEMNSRGHPYKIVYTGGRPYLYVRSGYTEPVDEMRNAGFTLKLVE